MVQFNGDLVTPPKSPLSTLLYDVPIIIFKGNQISNNLGCFEFSKSPSFLINFPGGALLPLLNEFP